MLCLFRPKGKISYFLFKDHSIIIDDLEHSPSFSASGQNRSASGQNADLSTLVDIIFNTLYRISDT